METTVTLPLWALVLILVLAGIALLDRLLVPSVRWALRRRANRAIDELNTRLRLRIQPFKLTKRQVLIDQLMFDPQILSAIETYASEQNVPRDVAMQKAKKYAREIVPSFSAYAYFKVGTRLARALSELLYRVRIGVANEDAIEKIAPESSVVFVINHRSNMDYVLVTYVAAQSSALSYAVGEWAQVFLLRSLIRSMGAYFVRRDSKNPLYRKILARYVETATRAGVVQAVFPEGGLSRDGRLRTPKLGLLSYMVHGFDPADERDVVFIPVGVNYDRVLEDRVLTSAGHTEPGKPHRFNFHPLLVLRFIFHNLWLRLTGRWHRFGYACVSFGKPISLSEYITTTGQDLRGMSPEKRKQQIETLGVHLMHSVGDVIPALPVSLVATVLLDATRPLTLFEVKGEVFHLMRALEDSGAYVHIPRADRDYAIDVGLRMLTMRHLVVEKLERFSVNPDETHLLRYYANAIAHLHPRADGAPRAVAQSAYCVIYGRALALF